MKFGSNHLICTTRWIIIITTITSLLTLGHPRTTRIITLGHHRIIIIMDLHLSRRLMEDTIWVHHIRHLILDMDLLIITMLMYHLRRLLHLIAAVVVQYHK